MVSRNLVICDQEERYAAALAHFFMKTKELALGVQVCNSVAQALRLQEESPIDILLIGSGYPQEERQKVRAESVFVLTQSACMPCVLARTPRITRLSTPCCRRSSCTLLSSTGSSMFI